MSVTAAHLRELMSLGLSGESLARVVEIIEDASVRTGADARLSDGATSRRKEADKLRKRAARAAAKVGADNPQLSGADGADSEAGQPETKGPPAAPSPVSPHTPHITPTPPPPPKTPVSARANPAGFDRFWEAFPNKTGKQIAIKAWEKVAKSKAVSFADLMAAVHRYAAKTDDRPWCNPATWLNQGRWADQPAQMQRAPPPRRRGGNGFLELSLELQGKNHGQRPDDAEFAGETIEGEFSRTDH